MVDGREGWKDLLWLVEGKLPYLLVVDGREDWKDLLVVGGRGNLLVVGGREDWKDLLVAGGRED